MTMARTAAALLSLPLPRAFHLVGYSMGARTALYLALSAPERVLSLVLESGSPGLADAREREARRASDEHWVRVLMEEGLSVFAARWGAQPLFATQRRLPAPVRRRIGRERRRQDPAGLAASLRGAGTGVQESQWENLRRLSLPVLVVAGERDAKFVSIAGAMAARMPTARVVVLPDCGHAPHLEAPAPFLRLLAEFWSGLPDAPRLPPPWGAAG
jgi:2-succinyl-6-hydroxy-2,4-cyclohexadiene-1-carboxylate synthase